MTFENLLHQLSESAIALNYDDAEMNRYISKFEQENLELLLNQLEEAGQNNIPFMKNIMHLLLALSKQGKIERITRVEEFTLDKLGKYNELGGIQKSVYIRIFLSVTRDVDLAVRYFQIFRKHDFLDVSLVEYFTDFFAEKEKGENFIDAFLIKEESWYRGTFAGDESSDLRKQQKVIIEEVDDNIFIYFLSELARKEEAIGEFLFKVNSFTKAIILKAQKLELYKGLYSLLVAILMHSNKDHYTRGNIYSQQTLDIFLYLKENFLNEGNIYQQLFNDISYSEGEFYYFTKFENFIANSLRDTSDIDKLLAVHQINEDKKIFLYRVYLFLEQGGDEQLISFLLEKIPDEISEWKQNQLRNEDANKKYKKEEDKKILDEIKFNIEQTNRGEKKYFVGAVLDDFLEKENYLRELENEGFNIDEIIKEQIHRFFTFENTNPNDEKILKTFKKTDSGYRAANILFDRSFSVVIKSAIKIGINLEQYKERISGFFPFTDELGTFKEKLLSFFSEVEIRNIFEIYRDYKDVRLYNPENLIYLLENKTELIISYPDLTEELVIFLQKNFIFEEKVGVYNKCKILKFLQKSGVGNSYFKKIFKKYSGKINYFKDYLNDKTGLSTFQIAVKANEILIENNNLDAILWRLSQLTYIVEDISNLPSLEERKGFGYITELESEFMFGEDDFIMIFQKIYVINDEITNNFSELLRLSLLNYREYYSSYVWRGFKRYLSSVLSVGKSDLNLLIGKLSRIILEENNKEAVIYFKRHIDDFSFFSKKLEEEIERNKGASEEAEESLTYKDKYNELLVVCDKLKNENIRLVNDLNNYGKDDIIILTEGPTDYYHFRKAWRELRNNNLTNKISFDFNIHLKKVENEEGKITWSCKQTYDYSLMLAQNFRNKKIFVILDCDELSFLTSEEQKILKKKKYLKHNSLNQYVVTFTNLPHHNAYKIDGKKIYSDDICTELFYNEKFLKGKFITKYYKNKWLYNKEEKKFGKPLYKYKDYFVEINNSNICDIKGVYSENGDAVGTRMFTTKKSFAQNIDKGSFDTDINLTTWKRFIPVFKKIDFLIKKEAD